MTAAACFDVLVVGGGIGGACMAGVLARSGLGVLVVEKEAAFRDRIRGEGTWPWGVAEARAAGLGQLLAQVGVGLFSSAFPILSSRKQPSPGPPPKGPPCCASPRPWPFPAMAGRPSPLRTRGAWTSTPRGWLSGRMGSSRWPGAGRGGFRRGGTSL